MKRPLVALAIFAAAAAALWFFIESTGRAFGYGVGR